jgi:hypothetical protein
MIWWAVAQRFRSYVRRCACPSWSNAAGRCDCGEQIAGVVLTLDRREALVHAPAAFRRRGVFVADYEIDAA